MVKTEQNAENIFNITNPEEYRTQVLHYHNRLSRLYLSVFKGQNQAPAFYLLFSDVGFLDCPMSWQGAQFDIAPEEECIRLLLETGLIGRAVLQFPRAYASITDYAKLYMGQSSGERPVRIIASSANMLRSLPSDIA
ncbi:MAG: hypothetical protein KC496_02715 [Anaerolineae bacterium]|nr:hypothetical protein [Anaerolineae bacterium]